jgi:hypothetical protein
MTSTLTRSHAATSDTDSATRYLELADFVDGLIQALVGSDGDADDSAFFAELAGAIRELADLSPVVHDPGTHAEQIRADVDAARLALLLSDLADARLHHRSRMRELLPALDARPYAAAVLDRMASRDDQPGWVLAHRLNCVIDHAIAAGLHTGLAERIAHAISHRPDGENAAEYEAAELNAIERISAAAGE